MIKVDPKTPDHQITEKYYIHSKVIIINIPFSWKCKMLPDDL